MSVAAIIFIAVGFILLCVEILIPGFGLIGVMGGVLMFVGVVIAGYMEGIWTAITYAGITITLSLVACVVGFWILPKTRIGKAFILSASEKSESGFRASPEELAEFAGKSGVTLTSLRPAGIMDIDGDRIDVVTRGEFIEKGEAVKVIEVEGSRIIVGA